MDIECFFGSPSSLNGINVAEHSRTMERIMAAEFSPSFPYTINGRQRTLLYSLADGIYLNWAIFIKSIKEHNKRKENICQCARGGTEGHRACLRCPDGAFSNSPPDSTSVDTTG